MLFLLAVLLRLRATALLSAALEQHPLVSVERTNGLAGPNQITVLATGPLTSENLAEDLRAFTGREDHYFDAASPIVDGETIDMERAFRASRYDKGDADYINCDESAEYHAFRDELSQAEQAELKDFEGQRHVLRGLLTDRGTRPSWWDTMRYGL